MKPIVIIIALVISLALGFWAGLFLGSQRARGAIMVGPYSDNFAPTRTELAQAIAKLRAGDTNVMEHLKAADAQIERAQQWSRRFIEGTNGETQ